MATVKTLYRKVCAILRLFWSENGSRILQMILIRDWVCFQINWKGIYKDYSLFILKRKREGKVSNNL